MREEATYIYTLMVNETTENQQLRLELFKTNLSLGTYKKLYNLSREEIRRKEKMIKTLQDNLEECQRRERTYIDYYPAGVDTSFAIKGNSVLIEFYRNVQVIPKEYMLCSGSMRPTFSCKNALIITRDFSEDDLKVGSIVGYKSEGEWNGTRYSVVVHRIVNTVVENNKKYYVTKGDNNQVEDGKITYDDIVFMVLGVIF